MDQTLSAGLGLDGLEPVPTPLLDVIRDLLADLLRTVRGGVGGLESLVQNEGEVLRLTDEARGGGEDIARTPRRR